MKTLSLVLVTILAGTISLRADQAHDISEKAVPSDKGQISDGYGYAASLYRIFTQNGVEAHLVQFDWSKLSTYEWTPTRSNQIYRASFVVFRDSEGRYFGQESTSIHAKWISGTTPEEWAKSFYSDAFTQVKSVDDNQAIVGYHPATRNQWAATSSYQGS